MKIIALLPMKANSERVIGKNFKDFGGKPLYRWMLDKLLQIDEIDEVVINTDAHSILKEAGLPKDRKLKIRNRRKEICGDFVSMNKVIKDDVENTDGDIYLMTHTTNPFLSIRSIKSGLLRFKKALKKNEADSLFTVNILQDRLYCENGKPINHDPNNLIRTQDLIPWFKENSNMYIFTKNAFFNTNARIGKKPLMLVTEEYESTDVDTQEDWDFAEVVLDFYKKKGLL